MSKMGAVWLELDSMGVDPEEATQGEFHDAVERIKKEKVNAEIKRLKAKLPAKPMEHLKDED